jgi:acyl-CoA thioesterase-2
VPEDRIAHSLHGYFILAGDISEPITYEVDITRDGGSFTTRRISAIQKGRAIFVMAASFQKRQKGFEHQIPMPNVLPPEVLLPDIEQIKDLKEKAPEIHRRLTGIHPNPIEFRPVEKPDPTNPNPGRPYQHIWIKSKDKVAFDLPLQHQILAWTSDYNLLTAAILPHRGKVDRANIFVASLDHAMWFHRDFRMDEWLLFAIDSPSASNSRGFSRGNFFDQSGRLVSSVVQEGLFREKIRKK